MVKNLPGLTSHFSRIHNIKSKEYYDKYIRKENEGICKIEGCKKETSFLGINGGYLKYCCIEHYYISESNKYFYGDKFVEWKRLDEYTTKFNNRKFRNKIKIEQNNIDPLTGKKLVSRAHLHHIDYNKQNDRRENLIFLNPSSHMKTCPIGADRSFWIKKLTEINRQIINKVFNFNGKQKN